MPQNLDFRRYIATILGLARWCVESADNLGTHCYAQQVTHLLNHPHRVGASTDDACPRDRRSYKRVTWGIRKYSMFRWPVMLSMANVGQWGKAMRRAV